MDENDYYGGAEAAFSLQEVDEWVEKFQGGEDSCQNYWELKAYAAR